ncbi:MAG: ATP-binding protein [Caldisericia bacterium]
MIDYEKLGVFYIGRPYNLIEKKVVEGLILYDSKDLVTHGVCIGMTGSGKTGLCIDILEEAAIDNIPAIAIDPKGDITNLLLTFPNLSQEDFLPWVNEDDARKKNLSIEEYAKEQAELWRNGLMSWGQSGERIKKLKESADFVIYTPGSNAGIPVSILKSFAAPPQAIINDSELLRDRIISTVTSLLGLLGREADPIKSKEHILISTILENAWKRGIDLDLSNLIHQIQKPSFSKIGVLDIENFYPSKERFELAMNLNNLLAAPGFNLWLEGEPLDIGKILYSPNGKPKISIFYIAHLNDAERMFFVSLLFNQILSWTRSQSGTTTLRAIVYMDEVFGFFPPVANPPSKAPLLALLKTARAFGVGILLSTQNPVDLDYKGLSNAGTWFLGRLQTERDKARVLDGLEGAAATTGMKFDRKRMEEILAGLGNRIFLMNNVHDDEPTIFETRWAMSYLRGPLTRNQIKILMDSKREIFTIQPLENVIPTPQPLVMTKEAVETEKVPSYQETSVSYESKERPLLPPGITQYFVPVRGYAPQGQKLVYSPNILGVSTINYFDDKINLNVSLEKIVVSEILDSPIPINWENSKELKINISELETHPVENAEFLPIPAVATNLKNYDSWSKDFLNHIYRTQELDLFKSPSFKEYSKPGESEQEFRIRLQVISHEKRDEELENIRKKYGAKVKALEEKVRKAQQTLDREVEQAKQQKVQTTISVGATILGAILGKKLGGVTNIGRATTAARGGARILKEQEDIQRAQETVNKYQQDLKDLEAELQSEIDKISQKIDPQLEKLEIVTIRPLKKDILLKLFALVWLPYYKSFDGKLTPAW